jgi:hypothetical protein
MKKAKKQCPNKKFRIQLIINTILLDRDGLYEKLDNESRKKIQEIIKKYPEEIEKLTIESINHQKTIRDVMIFKNFTFDGFQQAINIKINNSNFAKEIKRIDEIDETIYINLYNRSRLLWNNEKYENKIIYGMSNNCICSTPIMENIVLYHKDYDNKKLNLIIGNECVNTFEHAITNINDDIHKSENYEKNHQTFESLKSVNSKKVSKRYSTNKSLNEKAYNDNVVTREKKEILDKKRRYKDTLKFNDYSEIISYHEGRKSQIKAYCFTDKSDELYDIDNIIDNKDLEIINDEKVNITNEILKSHLDEILVNCHHNYPKINVKKILYVDYSTKRRIPTYIPDLSVRKNGLYELININVKSDGFIYYSWNMKEEYFTCTNCKVIYHKKNKCKGPQCLKCYKNEYGEDISVLRNNKEVTGIYTINKKEKMKIIECSECSEKISYNIYKQCPLITEEICCKQCA